MSEFRDPEQMWVCEMMPALVSQGVVSSLADLEPTMDHLLRVWRAKYPQASPQPYQPPAPATAPPSAPQWVPPVVPQAAPPAQQGRQDWKNAPEVDSATIEPADMSFFNSWADEKIGIGKKLCAEMQRTWSQVTWREALDHVPISQDRDAGWGFLIWLSTGLDNKTKASIEKTSRAKALVNAIDPTPFG